MRRHLRTLIVALLISAAAHAQAAPRFKAVAFDNFVIFNPNSVAPEVEKAFPGKGTEFTKAWRAKQFEYGFLRSIRTPRGLLQGHRGRARLHRCRDAAPAASRSAPAPAQRLPFTAALARRDSGAALAQGRRRPYHHHRQLLGPHAARQRRRCRHRRPLR